MQEGRKEGWKDGRKYLSIPLYSPLYVHTPLHTSLLKCNMQPIKYIKHIYYYKMVLFPVILGWTVHLTAGDVLGRPFEQVVLATR